MRIVMFVLAAAAALAAGLMARGLVSRPAATDKEVVEINKIKTVDVLVATKDVKMVENMITKDAKPDALDTIQLGRARANIYNGEIIVEKKVVLPGDRGFLAAILPKGMRAMSVAISERSSAGGFILPNDRVDLILTKKSSGEGGSLVSSETVLANVRVLAINQNYRQEQEGDTIAVPEGKTATIELTSRQAEVIAEVESMGELSLALRSIAESDGKSLEETPVLAEKYTGMGKPGGTDTLFVRYGRETYASNR
jgi:pilus assembly protein CpaB